MQTRLPYAALLAAALALAWQSSVQARGNRDTSDYTSRYPPRMSAMPSDRYFQGSWYGTRVVPSDSYFQGSWYNPYGGAQPPYGFGGRYYNGPYFSNYGPGVRQFLHFGGTDYYGR